MTITLYDSTYSGHCHKVRLFCGLLHLEVELEPIDTLKKEQKNPGFLKLNPFGQIPVMKDGDVVVRDSNAILLYLAERYDKARSYLPKDPVARAHVYEWLATAAGPLYLGPARARVIKRFGQNFNYEQACAVAEQLFAVMNDHLGTRAWLVGDGPTLGDVACYSYTAVADEGGLDLAAYPHIRAWLRRVEAIDGFVPMPRLPNG